MPTKQEQIDASLSELNEATNLLAAKIERLIAGQNPGDPVSQESLDTLKSVADNLRAMGSDASDPLPAPTPEPGTEPTDQPTG